MMTAPRHSKRAMSQAERVEAEFMEECEYDAQTMVKKLSREGIHGKGMYNDVVKMLYLGQETGVVEEKMRAIHGDF